MPRDPSTLLRRVRPASANDGASRREFLRHAALTSLATGVGAPLALNLAAMGHAAAQSAADYRALVCVFLFGGNDAFNTVLATDSPSWQAYTATRNQAPDSIALLSPGTAVDSAAAVGSPARLGGVLPITPITSQGRSFALHPLLGELRTMFDTERRLAIVSNVGPLLRPTSKSEYANASHPRPASLFSHNDQQNTWMAMAPEGVTIGWGGRFGDAVAASNNRAAFTAVSAAGNSVWLAGRNVQQYQVSVNGAIRIGSDANGRIYNSPQVAEALRRIMTSTRGNHVLEADLTSIASRSFEAEETLRTALIAASDSRVGTAPATGNYSASSDPKLQYLNPLTGSLTSNSLAQQFQVVARMVEAGMRGATGAQRQVFFVSMGGFDTHDLQNRDHARLMAQLAQALRYFDTALGALGARNNVTTFTASDFGRTFTSNGDGTDHGWGSHQFVMGGAVRGDEIYGRFPTLGTKNANNNNFDSSPDQLGNGSLLPEVSVDQFAATLGRWFGLSDSQLLEVFPALSQFDASRRNLGFMNA